MRSFLEYLVPQRARDLVHSLHVPSHGVGDHCPGFHRSNRCERPWHRSESSHPCESSSRWPCYKGRHTVAWAASGHTWETALAGRVGVGDGAEGPGASLRPLGSHPERREPICLNSTTLDPCGIGFLVKKIRRKNRGKKIDRKKS